MQYYPNIVDKINNAIPLPCLPHVLYKIIHTLKVPSHTPADITRLVQMDPSLSLKMLRLKINDGFNRRDLDTIGQSITGLGAGHLKNMILTTLASPVSNPQFWESGHIFNQFWLHSLRCAILSANLAQHVPTVNPDDAYVAGLLHDIGKLVLWTNFRKDYEPIVKKPLAIHQIVMAESTRIGTNHCETGCALLKTLNLNPLIGDAVLYHHWPAKDVAHALPVVKTVYAANMIAHIGEGAYDIDLFEMLGIDLKRGPLNKILAATERQLNTALGDLETSVEGLSQPATHDTIGGSHPVQTLLDQFREVCLIHFSVDQIRTDSGPEIALKQMLFYLKVYFDVYTAIFFYYDSKSNQLYAKATESDHRLRDIEGARLALQENGSLVARSLIDKKTLDSFGYLTNDRVSIADSQLIDLMGTGGMICIPLTVGSRRIGVICAGINEPQFPGLWKQQPIIEQFSERAAALLWSIFKVKEQAPEKIEVAARTDTGSIRKIIHEVNNPIGIIKNYLDVLGMKIGKNSGAQEELAIIREEIERIPGIIAQISGNGSAGAGDDIVDINHVIEDLARLLQKSVLEPSNITLHFQPALLLPDFTANRNNLVQVFTNLLKNSVEAMPDGGNITIRTAFVIGDEFGQGGKIVIHIRDDGPGISEDILKHLFEPGYSTKGPEHFGLGLSISQEILNRYDGSLTCTSSDQGTTFKISLPYSGEDFTWSME